MNNSENQKQRIGKTEENWSFLSIIVIAVMCVFVITLFIQDENSFLMQVHYKIQSAIQESNNEGN